MYDRAHGTLKYAKKNEKQPGSCEEGLYFLLISPAFAYKNQGLIAWSLLNPHGREGGATVGCTERKIAPGGEAVGYDTNSLVLSALKWN